MIEWIKDAAHLAHVREKNKEYFMLLFYADFSAPAKRALTEIEQFCKENQNVPFYVIDVEKVKGTHKQYAVKNVPTVVVVKKGKASWRTEGVESAQLYERIIGATDALPKKDGKKSVAHRVVVYSGGACPACGAAKSYLRQRGVHFRDIDISRDPHAAERLAQRSGQMAVPQIDIDGHLIVGFDQAKIDRLLSN
jgi:glutaredoxin-like YruB-family protein